MEIKLVNLEKKFRSGFNILIDNYIFTNKIYFLTGDNGSGKSTLLRLLAGVDSDYSGEISKVSQVLYLSSSNISFPYLTILENIEVFHNIYGIEIDKNKVEVFYDIEQLERLSKDASLGMNIKTALTLSFKKSFWDLIILDETISALDDKSRGLLMKELDARTKEGTVVIITTHDEICSEDDNYKILKISGGRLRWEKM